MTGPLPDDEVASLRERVAAALGPAGALITSSWTWYRRWYPTHLAVKNARVLDAASGAQLWLGDLDLTRDTDRLQAAARSVGRRLPLVLECGLAGSGELGVDLDFVLVAHPDGRLEPDPRRGYRRGGRLYRQTAAGYERWRRFTNRDDPARLGVRERARILARRRDVAPAELPHAARTERLAVALVIGPRRVAIAIPALGVEGQGVKVEDTLVALAVGLSAAGEASR